MALEPWYKVVTPRKEVREGRSFNPDEFAIHLEQVAAGTAPEDYRDPAHFFSRTCFTRALREHTGMVLRRLAGRTENSAPVLTLITQFGGGKTHTLAALYHLARTGPKAKAFSGIEALLQEADVKAVPQAKVGVFVGNAWDPQKGRETPWIDIARQLAGDEGVAALGAAAKDTPPGTEAIDRVFKAAGGCVLVLFDEVLNFLNRHRGMAESFHAFIQNLTVATTGTTRGAAIISLPRSQVEMTDWDVQWQEKITKVVRRVAKDLIANDEAEISEVIRRRLFDDIANDKVRKAAAKTYALWCYERRAQLPPEWTAVDTAASEWKAREFLQKRFEDCYPFHPATISVFQRKWQSLSQFQQTRGTLAMLAQWISWAYRDGYDKARKEPLITLGSAPLEVSEFRSVVLGQLGESRLNMAIETDIAAGNSHARALDADTKGPLRDIHRRVGTAIFFESSGGQVDKVAHQPELRFALGEPDIDTTTIDNAAAALTARGYYLRRVGADGFRINYRATLKKVVNDRKASLDLDSEVRPAMRTLVQKQFEKGASVPIATFPTDGTAVPDSPRLTVVLMDPEQEWSGTGTTREQIAQWTRTRGGSPRLYPASLVWCFRKPGRDLRDKVETWLSWKRVSEEVNRGELGEDYEGSELTEIRKNLTVAEEDARDEVWATYRFVVLSESQTASEGEADAKATSDGLRVIDLGAGHASAVETLCGRVIAALKTESLLNESVGASYLERHWPPALKTSGAWPLTSLRQSFLNGSLTRLLDPDTVLRKKVVEFVERGDFGLASGQNPDSTYERVWFGVPLDPTEVTFDKGMFLLTKAKAQALKSQAASPGTAAKSEPKATNEPDKGAPLPPDAETPPPPKKATRLVISGDIPGEVWNRLGTKLLPKLKAGDDLEITVQFSVTVKPELVANLETDLRQALQDLGLEGRVNIRRT